MAEMEETSFTEEAAENEESIAEHMTEVQKYEADDSKKSKSTIGFAPAVGVVALTSVLKNKSDKKKLNRYLQACLEGTINLKLKDETSGKYPIHLVAEFLNSDTLKKLLLHDKTIVDQKDSTDSTPLHWVIQQIKNETLNDVFKCIKILLEFDADINMLNKNQETPFTLLVKQLNTIDDAKKGHEILDYVNNASVFLDLNSKPDNSIIGVLQKVYPNLYEHRFTVCNFKDLSLDHINQKFLDYLPESKEKFMQTLCIFKQDSENKEIFEEILKRGDVLKKAVVEGLTDVAKCLIDLGADPLNKFAHLGEPPLPQAIYIACEYGRHEILKCFLEKCDTTALRSLEKPLLHHTLEHYKATNHDGKGSNYYETFDLLLENGNIDVNQLDKDGLTAVHWASKKHNVVSLRKLLRKKSAFIGRSEKGYKDPPIGGILPQELENYFNSCITTKGNPGEEDYELTIDYTCMVVPEGKKPDKSEVELSIIQYLATSKTINHLILHPLITSFLFLKWCRLRPVFYANIAVYLINCIPIVSYIVFCYNHGEDSIKCEHCDILKWWAFASSMYIFIREILQFLFTPNRYFQNIENYLEIALIALVWLVLFGGDYFTNEYRRMIGGFTILLAMTETTHLIGSLPIFSLSTDMAMLKKVSMTFIRILALYAVILFSFALSFYSMIGNYGADKSNQTDTKPLDQFKNVRLAIVKTIVMFSGEFDASQIDFHGNIGGYIVFVVFVFFISIVMMNLLMGLAVSDTEKIKEDADSTYWTERAKLLTRYEQGMKSTVLPWINKISAKINFFPKLLPENKISIIVNSKPKNKIKDPTTTTTKEFIKPRGMFGMFFENLFLDSEIVQKALDVTGTYKDKKSGDIEKQGAQKQIKTIDQNVKKVMLFEEKLKKIEENVVQMKELFDKIHLQGTVKAAE